LKISEWKKHIEKERQAKNRFFILDPRSPVPRGERRSLLGKGLSYYPPDPDLLFELFLHEHGEKKKIKVETTKGGVQEFIRWGEFRFDIDDKQRVIQAYKSLDFNKAYNPWCAYSEEYVCPFIPPENWLEIPIRAGEKKYPLERKGARENA